MFENLNSLISKKQKIYEPFEANFEKHLLLSFYYILLNVRAGEGEGEGEGELGLGLRLRLGLGLG